MKSKTFLKIGFGTLIVFLLSFLMIFILYNNQYKKEYNLWQEALKAKYLRDVDGEVLEKDTFKINEKEYNLVKLRHSDMFGFSDTNIYLFDENIDKYEDVRVGEHITIYCNYIESPEMNIKDTNAELIDVYNLIENKPIYSDLLLIAICIGLPGTTIIFVINMIIFIILKIKETKLKKVNM